MKYKSHRLTPIQSRRRQSGKGVSDAVTALSYSIPALLAMYGGYKLYKLGKSIPELGNKLATWLKQQGKKGSDWLKQQAKSGIAQLKKGGKKVANTALTTGELGYELGKAVAPATVPILKHGIVAPGMAVSNKAYETMFGKETIAKNTSPLTPTDARNYINMQMKDPHIAKALEGKGYKAKETWAYQQLEKARGGAGIKRRQRQRKYL